MLTPIFLPVLDEWLGRIRLYEGPISHRRAWFPALRMHLVLTELFSLQLFWYPKRRMVALHAGTHMLKKALNLKFMLADRALPEVGLTLTSTSLLLFKFTAHFPQRDQGGLSVIQGFSFIYWISSSTGTFTVVLHLLIVVG